MGPRKSLVLIVAVLAFSCNRSGIVNDAPVRLARPDKVVSKSIDTAFRNPAPEVLHCFFIQIINDTLLIVQDQASEDNTYHFKAYSTNTFNYLGAFVRKGRGPGEMLHPHIVKCTSSERSLNVNDNSLSLACAIDVEESISSRNTAIVQNTVLPPGVIDWLPLPDSRQFVLQSEKGEMIFRTIGSCGEVLRTFDLYGGHNSEWQVTYLSSIFLNDGKTGKVAEVMLFFPQVNIIDTEKGHVYSVAVSKDYRKWKSVMDSMIGMDTKEYYAGAASSPDYIFAAYRKHPIIMQDDSAHYDTSIHVFDWNGKFLYRIEVDEEIGSMAFDSRTKFLYGIDRGEGRIVRYDLSGLI
ncbi:MAG: TolB-like 6-bladed beta-propeller domain-containing protein [Clostridium sp.]|nr:TolB-like 6-bladed beta-propeller domain-containing protein [Bacteroides sp.]MCM1198103.1 TolB-like 6-bladed beta-propeller domain-containing protein [Clostridium sp.]